jgi:hypothetical protein
MCSGGFLMFHVATDSAAVSIRIVFGASHGAKALCAIKNVSKKIQATAEVRKIG